MKNTLFGRVRRPDFPLADEVAHLNHGSFGGTPYSVLAAADEWRLRMERDPTAFFRRDLVPALRSAAARVAASFGGAADDWAFVENATAGINAVIAGLDLQPGDEVVCLSHVYAAIRNTLDHYAARRGLVVRSVPVILPFTDADALVAALKDILGPRTRLAVFDHVTSASAIVMPLAALAAACRDAGVPVAVDGAHAPGLVPLDVPTLGVDWYVGNLHKWAFAPKGTAVMWCAPHRKATTRPLAISHDLGKGFPAEFDYAGTRDNSHWLAATAGLDYLDRFGGDAIRAHNDALAQQAADLLTAAWGTEAAAAAPFRTAMISVALPNGGGLGRTDARRIAQWLSDARGITAGVMVADGRLWLRVSAQIYNELDDYRGLIDVPTALAAMR